MYMVRWRAGWDFSLDMHPTAQQQHAVGLSSASRRRTQAFVCGPRWTGRCAVCLHHRPIGFPICLLQVFDGNMQRLAGVWWCMGLGLSSGAGLAGHPPAN